MTNTFFLQNSHLPLSAEIAAISIPAYDQHLSNPVSTSSTNKNQDRASVSSSNTDGNPSDEHSPLATVLSHHPNPRLLFRVNNIRIIVNDDIHTPIQSPSHRVQFFKTNLHTHIFYPLPSNTPSPQLPSSLHSITSVHPLPNAQHHALWYKLMHPPPLKSTLLSYLRTLSTVADHHLPPSLMPLSHLILLCGPPGTGKTSLAYALATITAIRNDAPGVLLHARLDQLMSRWFGDSPRLIATLLRSADRLARNAPGPTILLLDEVDAVAMSRGGSTDAGATSGMAYGGASSTDAHRAVNALLTGLDHLSNSRLVVVGTTNFHDALDPAFVDRADLLLYVDAPTPAVSRQIVVDTIEQLVNRGIVRPASDVDIGTKNMGDIVRETVAKMEEVTWSRIAGLSARRIAKLPAVALSLVGGRAGVSLDEFANALVAAVAMESALSGNNKKADMVDGESI